MKIYFCDECNESIPLSDIEANRISIDGGKIYCHDCAPKPPRTSPMPVRTWTLLAGMLLCVGLGMAVMAVWGDRLLERGEGQTLAERVAALESRLDARREGVDERLRRIEGDLEETPAADGREGKLARALAAINANGGSTRQLSNRLEGLGQDLRGGAEEQARALAEMKGRVEAQLQRLDVAINDNLVEDLRRIHGELEVLRDRQQILDDRIANIEAISSGLLREGSALESARIAEKEALSPEMERLLDEKLRDLGSDKPNVRYAAAIWFMEVEPPIRTRRGEQALVERLADESDFVVTAALASLAQMGARWTIPNVIESLTSRNEFIVDAAIEALEKLTGQKLDLDAATAKPEQVESKVRELRSWWRDNKDGILAGK